LWKNVHPLDVGLLLSVPVLHSKALSVSHVNFFGPLYGIVVIMIIMISHIIYWLNYAPIIKPKRKNNGEQMVENDPLGFIGGWVSTRYGMSSGDFRYGSTFYIKSFNKRKKCYIATCPPMGKTEINLSVQTLIDFEAFPRGGKHKQKTNGEQMATLDELFEGEDDRERGTDHSEHDSAAEGQVNDDRY